MKIVRSFWLFWHSSNFSFHFQDYFSCYILFIFFFLILNPWLLLSRPMSDQQDQRVKEDDCKYFSFSRLFLLISWFLLVNPVIMKGNLSFSHALPVWNGLWNYRISNISDQIKQKRVFHYTRTSLVPPFLDNECKGNLNKLYEGPENSSTENDVYLENRKFLLLCELSGVYEGSFVFESVRYAINETFCLCYPNKELQFQR